ncbi:ABC transporter [Clavulina sp. PMI_390]|nr:ABC transporter [Clavulina sp. PMI_390]
MDAQSPVDPVVNEKEPQEAESASTSGSGHTKLAEEVSPKGSTDKEVESGAAGEKAEPTKATAVEGSERWLTGSRLLIVHSAMLLSILLVAIDQSIVATALPHIISQFNALSNISWVASAYFLTQAGFILFYGGVLSIFPTKWVFMFAVTLFELGSLICGVAPNMNVLIFGRALAGVGAAGIFGSCIATIAEICPLEMRPALMGSFGGVFALASVMGPLLGGVFTDHVSWRWCFYINLPIGGISVAVIAVAIKARYTALNDPANHAGTPLKRFIHLDWVGTLVCLGLVCSLLLPLQWGGNTKPWSDKSVIALFCVFGVVLVAFLIWEYRMGMDGLLPLALFRNRSQIGCCLSAFWIALIMLSAIYYLPLLYQAKGHSATKSGIDILPFMMMCVGGAVISGGVITWQGRYWWWLVLSPLLATIGAGLMFTVDANTSNAKLIGYQVILGFGVGGAMQNSFLAIQAEYNHDESLIPRTSSLVTFTQLVGGVIGIAIAGTIFANSLETQLHHYAPNLDPATAAEVRQSVTIIFTLPPDVQGPVIAAYSKAIAYVFTMAIPSGIMSSLCALMVRDHDIRNMKLTGGGAA